MRKTPLTAIAAMVAAAGLALAGCAAGADSGGDESAAEELIIASVAGSTGDTALSLAQEHGIFEDAGFVLKRVTVQSAPAALAAAQSGQVDIAYAPSIPLLNAILRGVPLHIVMAADGFKDDALQQSDLSKVDDTSLYASKASGITEVSQLKGKTIAIPARSGQFEVVVTNILKENGIGADEVNWVVLDYQSAVNALKTGDVDAATLLTTFSAQAAQAGMTYVTSPSVKFFERGAVGLWSAGSKLAADKERVAKIQRVIVEANKYANEHTAEAKKKSIELTGAKVSADEMGDPYWPLTVDTADITRVNERLVALGFLPKAVDLDGVILPQP